MPQFASTQGIDLPFVNKGSSAISAKSFVRLLTTPKLGLAGTTVSVPAIDIPATAGSELVIGVAMEDIAVGAIGRVRVGGIATVVASGSVTQGDLVQCDTASGHEGQGKTAGSAKYAAGQALADASDAGDLPVLLFHLLTK